jgi:hypothetical protein
VPIPDETVQGRLNDRGIVLTVYDNEVADGNLQVWGA